MSTDLLVQARPGDVVIALPNSTARQTSSGYRYLPQNVGVHIIALTESKFLAGKRAEEFALIAGVEQEGDSVTSLHTPSILAEIWSSSASILLQNSTALTQSSTLSGIPGGALGKIHSRELINTAIRTEGLHVNAFKRRYCPYVHAVFRDEEQSINYEVAERHKHLRGHDGIFTFGSNGRFHVCNLTEDKFSSLLSGNHRSSSCLCRNRRLLNKGALYMSREAEAIGANALSVINPYFLGISDQQLVSTSRQLLQALDSCPSIQRLRGTGKNISKEAVERLSH